ncbi:hypothetical protein LTR37_014241 [Vermiconidia calcicola]|uniref:Uncharacterized protein n=1 Tax=Vermiconidia calcicola TaxID=1690605 RepID=A0ACC3MU61_9PEZI|nr:hypothetical protein LTR37_014241 [Vermiconidia calcicola]
MASKWIPSLRRHKKDGDTSSTQESGTHEETNTQQQDTNASTPQDVKSEGENATQQEPVLNNQDQKFLENQISTDESAQKSQGEPVMKISDDGEMKEASKEEQEQAGDSVIVPETKPEASNESAPNAEQQQAGNQEDPPETQPEASKEGTQEGSAHDSVAAPDTKPADRSEDSAQDVRQKQSEDSTAAPESRTETGDDGVQGQETEQSYDDVMKEKAAEAKNSRKSKKDKSFDLPSQEEAEAATKKGLDEQAAQEGDSVQGGKRSWTSYIPSVRPSSSSAKKGEATDTNKEGEPSDSSAPQGEASEGTATAEDSTQRTWKDYVPSIPTISTSWKSNKDSKDAQPEVVYNEDGTVNEDATQDKQEREISALLSNLNLNAFNNRVFAVSGETQKYYERFAQCLKDIINGAPTAYQDLDQLMHEAGPQLQKQFESMPPFLQTLVKSLPMKMGPEIMAAASEKPGNDMQARMKAASQQPATGESDASLPGDAFGTAEKEEEGGDEKEGQQKKKRTIPGLKSLVGEKSAVSSMLRAAVSFLQTRFPFLASMTNVIMSLAVFILMFVFWYCHKRGKEVRLAREAEGKELKEGEEDEVLEVSGDEAEGEDEDPELSKQIDEAADSLSQPTSAEKKGIDGKAAETEKVAETEKSSAEKVAEQGGGEKGLETGAEKAGGDQGAELEAEKAVGV